MADNNPKAAAGLNKQTTANYIYSAIAAIDKNSGAPIEASASYYEQYDALRNYDITDIYGENLDTPNLDVSITVRDNSVSPILASNHYGAPSGDNDRVSTTLPDDKGAPDTVVESYDASDNYGAPVKVLDKYGALEVVGNYGVPDTAVDNYDAECTEYVHGYCSQLESSLLS